MQNMMKRVKNPKFLLAISGILYIILKKNNIMIDLSEYQLICDLIAYSIVGIGIYTKYE